MIVHGADLQPFNTLNVAAQADYFVEVKSLDDLSRALQWRKQQSINAERDIPIMVLGGGSNLVLADDFHGLVIKMAITDKDVVKEDDQHVWLRAGAGENWHELIKYCMGFHYWGLENMALIPGSVGAAPIQNIGAYGTELCDVFAELSAVEISSGVSVNFDRDACRFGYRDSIFKQRFKDRYIITSVTLKLPLESSPAIRYPALQQYFDERNIVDPTHFQVFDAVCDIRRSKLPDPETLPNVGSFFKNPMVVESVYTSLKQAHPDIVAYPDDKGMFKLAAGWLIDQAGWRGYRDGDVAVHERQALVIVNPGQGNGRDVLSLASRIQDDIAQRFGVDLEIEPRVYA
ncbi:MAG: UDP-N-acetylmuramate dehydrogenase [Candidatus Pelagadaptatus aseana]|uniref:UDP-N-acetylmuramate dehydrogenase n=1 Tax=Candidatus Pelagadaptatus aseana TaxID=3120508 RepID=UPI0039B1519C